MKSNVHYYLNKQFKDIPILLLSEWWGNKCMCIEYHCSLQLIT